MFYSMLAVRLDQIFRCINHVAQSDYAQSDYSHIRKRLHVNYGYIRP